MTPRAHGKTTLEFPSDLEVQIRREFAAPIGLVFDVFTKEEHVRQHFAPFAGEVVTVCDIDLRVGGDYHYVFLTVDGREMSFRGTFAEIDPPRRTAQTWTYEGWPGVVCDESIDLVETSGGTELTWRLKFRDMAGRDHMRQYDGIEASFNNVEHLLWELLDA